MCSYMEMKKRGKRIKNEGPVAFFFRTFKRLVDRYQNLGRSH